MPKFRAQITLAQEILTQKKVANFLNRKFKKSKSSSTYEIYRYGLAHFQTFLFERYPKEKYTLETILPLLSEKKIKVYPLLDEFIEYLEKKRHVSPRSIKDYLTPVRSFFQYEDEYEIDVSKFRDRVTMPHINGEREEAINAKIVGNILKACSNRRLKAFLSILASSGIRSTEGISLRMKDIELSEETGEPSIIHVRAQYAKTRIPRDVFITSEATEVLQQWLSFKYRRKGQTEAKRPHPEDLIFTNRIVKETDILAEKLDETFQGVYIKLNLQFNKILETIGLGERKEGSLRRKITFHSFRRFVKTTLSDQVNSDFSEYILGHKNDMGYYTKTKDSAKELYRKAVNQLTFLDTEQFEITGKNIQKQLDQKEKQIQLLLREQENMKRIIIAMQKERLEDTEKSQFELKEHFKLENEYPQIVNQYHEAQKDVRRKIKGYYDQPVFDGLLMKEDPKYEEKSEKFDERVKTSQDKIKKENQAIIEKFRQDYKRGKYPNMTEVEAARWEFSCHECHYISYKKDQHYPRCSKYDERQDIDIQEHDFYYPEALDEYEREKKR